MDKERPNSRKRQKKLEEVIPKPILHSETPSIPKKPLNNLSNGRMHGKDTRRLLKIVCCAFINPGELLILTLYSLSYVFNLVYIPWDIEEFYNKSVKGGGRKDFPNLNLGFFSEPLTVIDSKGRIVLWYLPGLLSEQQEVCL
jgi:hypothetical protein